MNFADSRFTRVPLPAAPVDTGLFSFPSLVVDIGRPPSAPLETYS